MHYVYILYSADHDKYYVGQTPDVDTRLLFHNELSEKSYTSRYRPWSMVCKMQVSDRGVAMRIERYIKSRKIGSFATGIEVYPEERSEDAAV